jgi:hypothetical protein
VTQHLGCVCGRRDDEHEAHDAEHDDIADEPDEDQGQPDEHAERAEHDGAAAARARTCGAHGRCELGVFGIQGLLDLVEQPLLVLGERHRALLRAPALWTDAQLVRIVNSDSSSPRRVGGPTDCQL